MKKNNGISMITLMVTIIILIILAGMSLYYGVLRNLDTAADTFSFNEIFEVSEAIAQRSLMNRMNSSKYGLVGKKLTDINPELINDITYGEGWYKIDPKASKELDLENIKGSYVVNYATGEVVSVDPIYYKDVEYYTTNELRDVVGGADLTYTDDMYDAVKGVNKPVLKTGMIPVKNVNNKWIVTNSSDEEWYDYSSEKKLWANVMLTDEVSVQGYTNEQIRNASLAELEGRVVTTSGSMFVWIPRYTNNSTGEVIYSYLTTDYTKDGYTLNSAFTNENKQLTGIWISKYDAEFKD